MNDMNAVAVACALLTITNDNRLVFTVFVSNINSILIKVSLININILINFKRF